MNYLTHRDIFSSITNDVNVLFKDLFETESFFSTLPSLKKIDYPVDIVENKDGIEIDVAAIGLDKEDIKIDIKDRILQISYNKQTETDKDVIYRGITKKSFKHAWKISDAFNISDINAKLEKGMLRIKIPKAPEKTPEEISIKIQ